MREQYYIRSRGSVQGPFSLEWIHKLARRGEFSRHYQISTDLVNWQPAASFPELFARDGVPSSAPASSSESQPLEMEARFEETDPSESTNGSEWFYTKNGIECGPVSASELSSLAENGELEPEAFVWADGMAEWIKADSIPEILFSETSSAGSPDKSHAASRDSGRVHRGFACKSRTRMGKIFISYRRDDSADIAGRIYDRLCRHFGQDSVFMDVDNIPYGVVMVHRELESCRFGFSDVGVVVV